MSRFIVLVLFAGCSFQGTAGEGGTADASAIDGEAVTAFTGYRARRPIDIDNSDRGELSRFPVYVRLSDIDATKVGALGEGLRFVANDHETELAYELEVMAAPQIHAWVAVELPDDANLRIWAYYDAETTPTSTSNAMAVFGDYHAVYHFADSFGSGDASQDSSGNGRNLDAVGLDSTVDQDPTGAFGPAVSFIGSGDYLEAPAIHPALVPAIGGAATYEVRFRSLSMDLALANGTVFDTGASARGVGIKLEEGPIANVNTGEARGTIEYSDGTLNRVAFAPSAGRVDDSSGRQFAYSIDLRQEPYTHTLFVEGASQGAENLGTVAAISTGALRVGEDLGTPGQPFRGVIDELRIGPLRPPDWHAAVTSNAAGNLVAIGPEESLAP